MAARHVAAAAAAPAVAPFGEWRSRKATSIIRSCEAELSFLGQVFRFEPADEIARLEVVNLDSWRAAEAIG